MPLTSTWLCTLHLQKYLQEHQQSQLEHNLLETMLQQVLHMVTETKYAALQNSFSVRK